MKIFEDPQKIFTGVTSTEFNNMPPLPSDTFSSLHINVRSLPKHFDEFLLTLNRSFSVIAVSEIWLHRSNSDLFHFSLVTVRT